MNTISSSNSIIYTRAAAARILTLDIDSIIDFRVWAYVCFVRVQGQKATFISKKLFQLHFADWRIKRSKSFHLAPVSSNVYRVTRPLTQRVETVSIAPSSITCSCCDYQIQTATFGNHKGCCTHIYRVLSHLGYQRLNDYQKQANNRLQPLLPYSALSNK